VHERGGEIVHACDAPLNVGERVAGRIDWARRFDHMQQHSGEHIISGILCEMFDCDNVGFHLGADAVTIDYNAEIPWEGLMEAEARSNAVIWEDREAEITFPPASELETMSYRSKKALSGDVRIVTFPGADCCACCGTHVRRAGQVGLVKVISCQKFRDGVRIEILCGKRALGYLSAVFEQGKAVGQRLSVKPTEILPATERLEAEISAAKERISALEQETFEAAARECAGAGNVLLFRAPMRPDSVRRLADTAARTCGGLAAAFAGQDGAGYVYALVRADGRPIAVKGMNAALHGRGGGRGGFAQGSVQAAKADIEAFFREHPGLSE
jgi:alanyl-tRNA synthetase